MEARLAFCLVVSVMVSVSEHYKEHQQLRTCTRCIWGKNKERWRAKLPTLSAEVLGGCSAAGLTRCQPYAVDPHASWAYLKQKGNTEEFVVSCRFCSDFAAAKPKFHPLLRHHKSARHIGHVRTYLQLELGPSKLPVHAAPPASAFQKVLNQGVHSGDLFQVGCKTKVEQMQQCLGEAFAEQCRNLLLNAATVCLMRDESKGYLQLRAQVCTKDLTCKSFLVGIMKNSKADAFGINTATVKLIKEFLDKDASSLDAVLGKIEAITVDSASSELKAARIAGENKLMPNMVAILRDRAHATRRLLTRGLKAVHEFDTLVSMYVHDRHSIVQRIHNSDTFKAEYKHNVHALDGPFNKSSNLSAAKHRFESYAKPLQQFVMTLPAILATAQKMSLERKEEPEGKDADNFLASISTEHVTMLGCITDCAHEVLWLTRLHDEDHHDLSGLVHEVQVFRKKVDVLCSDGFNTEGTYMKSVVDFLEKQQTTFEVRGGMVVRAIGGKGSVTVEMKERCLGHLRTWRGMSDAILTAEFPDFELIQAFHIFDLPLSSTGKLARLNMTPAFENYCQRLAAAFHVDCAQLKMQIAFFRDSAFFLKRDLSLCSADAWCMTVKRRCAGARYKELQQVLTRYLGWGISTSPVERDFVTVRKELWNRPFSSSLAMATLMRMASMKNDTESHERILGRAREIWASRDCGPSRKGSLSVAVSRADACIHGNSLHRSGSRTDAEDAPTTAVSWNRARRRSLEDAASKLEEVQSTEFADASDRVQKELEFNRVKRRRREIEALSLGHLLPHEQTEDLLADAKVETTRQSKLDNAAVRKRCLDEAKNKSNGLHLSDIRKMSCCMPKSVDTCGTMQFVKAWLLKQVKLEAFPEVMIVSTIAEQDLGGRNKHGWIARLIGSYMINADSMVPLSATNNNFIVPCKKYIPAVGIWRTVLISKGFATKYHRLIRLLKLATNQPGNKWTLLEDTEANRQSIAVKFAKHKKQPQFCMLLTSTELADPSATHGLPAKMKKLNLDQFVTLISKPDPVHTASSVTLSCRHPV